ncbi:helix-turn-helix domain-containing protein [Saccharothrix longispora]|uniref:TetR/AcrR family transcriptional regulator n=1 Tax=Saccharothrix longispora TaxID=33920 RepID=UPI0028FD9E48|nr:helix-turn-helix domain-containing protein [Saccharothrix longispora]MBY8850720.1 TetR/AcrR family transcriptional regulator [Saccharothrix sp. MB29]MDU0288315.1 helix-turn-helix domain-containing protein [Saccharothrix longispora]
MPRISADTLAQHRANRLRALLDAGRDIVAEEGADALTLASLARRVGLSRPSLYEYFRSREELVAAIVSDELPDWARRLADAVRAVEGVPAKVEAYLRTELEIVADGSHGAVVALSAHALPEAARTRIRVEHEKLLAPLVDVLAEARVPEPGLRALLVHGAVEAAARTLRPGDAGHNETVVAALVAQVLHGVVR